MMDLTRGHHELMLVIGGSRRALPRLRHETLSPLRICDHTLPRLSLLLPVRCTFELHLRPGDNDHGVLPGEDVAEEDDECEVVVNGDHPRDHIAFAIMLLGDCSGVGDGGVSQ